MLKYLLESLEKNRQSITVIPGLGDEPEPDAPPEPGSPPASPKSTPAKSRYFLPPYHEPLSTPVWAVEYDHKKLIHSPSSISFQNHHANIAGQSIRTLPVKPNESTNKKKSKAKMSSNGGPQERVRRLPNFVQVADAYIFQQTIDERLRRVGVTQQREDHMRIAGVQYIDSVRRVLKL